MNYRHAFHAGNFADVVKHALLARVVAHLRKKPTSFRLIDTHAGSGLTDLHGDESRRGGEWQSGIGRLWHGAFDDAVRDLLEPYLTAIAAFNPVDALRYYPGSPLLMRQWLRPQDRMIACELEPEAMRQLSRNLGTDQRIKAIGIDGWTAMNAYIPPKERRGLVLTDPPYERENELARAAAALGAAHRKWPEGIMLLWYPIKDYRENIRFAKSLRALPLAKSLQIELSRNAETGTRLRGTGLMVVNAPWTLAAEAQILLAALGRLFWPDERCEIRVESIGAA